MTATRITAADVVSHPDSYRQFREARERQRKGQFVTATEGWAILSVSQYLRSLTVWQRIAMAIRRWRTERAS